jgi:hypothetical protein
MRRKPTNMRLLSLLVLLLACAQFVLAEGASNDHRPGFLPAYDKSQETAFTGTIAQVVPHPSTHSLIGIHMMVVSANGMRDVHLGSFVPKEVLENVLRTNTTVQVIGMNTTQRGQQVVLARQIITGGRTITIRDEHGFLALGAKPERTHHTAAGFGGGRQ